MPTQDIEKFIRLSCIDDLPIPDEVIYKCRKEYEFRGKPLIYDKLNNELYETDYSSPVKTNRTLRYLNLYRQAYAQSRCAFYNLPSSEASLSIPKKIPGIDYNKYCCYCGKELKNKMCLNVNCPIKTSISKKHEWEYENFNAAVPILDSIAVGYTSKAGFKLDDYDYQYKYPDSRLTMETRGGGIGFPRNIRFDFEYRFIKNIPNYIEIYKNILFCTFKKVLHYIVIYDFDTMMTKEEIDAALLIVSELSKYEKDEFAKFLKKFIAFVDKYKIKPVTDEEKLIYEEEKVPLITYLFNLHNKLMLPVEFMCLVMLLTIYPRHFLVLSDTAGGISSKLHYGKNIFTPENITDISITHNNGTPIDFTCAIDNVFRYTLDNINFRDSYYVMTDKNFNMSVYSFAEMKWLENSSLNLFNKPDELIGEIVKLFKFEYNNKVYMSILTNKAIAVFNFTDNIWENINDKFVILNTEIFSEDDNFVDADYSLRENQLILISSSKFRIFDMNTKALSDIEINSGSNPIVPEIIPYDDTFYFKIKDNNDLVLYMKQDSKDPTIVLPDIPVQLITLESLGISSSYKELYNVILNDRITLYIDIVEYGRTEITFEIRIPKDKTEKYLNILKIKHIVFDKTDEYLIDKIHNIYLSNFNKVIYNFDINENSKTKNDIDDLIYYTLSDINGNIQIIKYDKATKTISIYMTIYYMDKYSPVIKMISVDETKSIYIIYENMRIIKLENYIYTIKVLQDEYPCIMNLDLKYDNSFIFKVNKSVIPNTIEIYRKDIVNDIITETLLQTISLAELNISEEYNEINGILLINPTTILVDIRYYGYLIVTIEKNTEITDLNKKFFNIIETKKFIGEKIVTANKFILNNEPYISYVTNKNDNKNIYSYNIVGKNLTSDGNFEKITGIISDNSEVLTYDEMYVYPTDMVFKTDTSITNKAYSQKDSHMSQK